MVERPVYFRMHRSARQSPAEACESCAAMDHFTRTCTTRNVRDETLVRAPGSARGDMSRTVGLAEKLWAGFWYTRARCLQNETTLFDHLLRNKVRSGIVGS